MTLPCNPLLRRCLATCLLAFSVFALPGRAQGTHLWTQTHVDELEHGTPSGVAIGSDGVLRQGPRVGAVATTASTFVWALATSANGTTYAATGSPATVVALTASGQRTLFTTRALAVTALALGPDGALYAATIPDGRVFRLQINKADSKSDTKAVDETTAELVFDLSKPDLAKPDLIKLDLAKETGTSGAHYIWDLTFDSTGRLYIATGAPGAIYRVTPQDASDKPATAQPAATQAAARPELFFSTDEAHIRTLAWDRAGNLIAGSDGSGLVYRIGQDGKGFVLFSAPRREITSIAVAGDGAILAAAVGDKAHNPLPQLPLQTSAGITISFSQPGSMQAANASTTLPEGTEIYQLRDGQAPRRIWAGKDEIVYRLAETPAGLLALTGNRGRLLLIHNDGSWADVAHLEAQQATAFAPTQSGYLIGTANTGRIYPLYTREPDASSVSTAPGHAASFPHNASSFPHSYASDVLDAGTFSRWGRIETTPDSHGYRLFTRSGNVEEPVRRQRDWGWSEWQPVENGRIVSPAARYIEWRADLSADGMLSGVGVNYLPVNAAPVVDEVMVVPGARATPPPAATTPASLSISFPAPSTGFDASSANTPAPLAAQKEKDWVTARWSAHDDNGDDLAYDIYLRGDHETVWRLLKGHLTEKFLSFDATTLPDGGYTLRVVASDAPSHNPGEALTAELISDRFELDTTPPTVANLTATDAPPSTPTSPGCADCPARTLRVHFTARDSFSPVTHAEYSLDAGPWHYVAPQGGLADDLSESYEVAVPVPDVAADTASDPARDPAAGASHEIDAEHIITVRVYDRYDNTSVSRVIVPARNKVAAQRAQREP